MSLSLLFLYLVALAGWICCGYAIWSWRDSINNLIRFVNLRYKGDDPDARD